MEDEGLNDVIVIGPPKEAALYFERVFPIDLARALMNDVYNDEVTNFIPFNGVTFDNNVVESLLPKVGNATRIYVDIVIASFSFYFLNFLKDRSGDDDLDEEFLRKLRKIFLYYELDFDRIYEDIRKDRESSYKYFEKIFDRGIHSVIKQTGFLESPM